MSGLSNAGERISSKPPFFTNDCDCGVEAGDGARRLGDSTLLFSQDWTPIDEAQDWIVALLLDENNLPLTFLKVPLSLHQKSLSFTIGLEVDRSTTKDLW